VKITTNEKELRVACLPATLSEGEEIAKQLYEKLATEPGIGLAANQIGINKKVFVMKVQTDYGVVEGHFVNPRILEKKNLFIFEKEGCLSYPDKWIETLRFYDIVATADNYSDPIILSGLPAVVYQHETAHTNALTMYDFKLNKFGPNDKCPCESGKKFKKCCHRNLQRRPI